MSRLHNVIQKYSNFGSAINYFISRDPSKNLKYLEWELKILSSGQALAPEIADVVDLFHKHSHKLEVQDLYQYQVNDFARLRDILFEIDYKQKQKKHKIEQRYALIEEPDAPLVYEDEEVLIRLSGQSTYSASEFYGVSI